jgi:GT2 family glycosyltransferase
VHARNITLSIISHRQGALIRQLIEDIGREAPGGLKLIITENVPETPPLAGAQSRYPLQRIANSHIKGFGANHNTAFQYCETPFFCVVNPDIRLSSNPFPTLLRTLDEQNAAAVGPLVRASEGRIEDSARRFPTLGSLVRKALHEKRSPDYPTDAGPAAVDWVAGMFVLFRSDAFRAIGGFDERYFLYYEDVDICWRLRNAGYTVVYEPRAEVTHNAQRASRQNLRLARHHVQSAVRFLLYHH